MPLVAAAHHNALKEAMKEPPDIPEDGGEDTMYCLFRTCGSTPAQAATFLDVKLLNIKENFVFATHKDLKDIIGNAANRRSADGGFHLLTIASALVHELLHWSKNKTSKQLLITCNDFIIDVAKQAAEDHRLQQAVEEGDTEVKAPTGFKHEKWETEYEKLLNYLKNVSGTANPACPLSYVVRTEMPDG